MRQTPLINPKGTRATAPKKPRQGCSRLQAHLRVLAFLLGGGLLAACGAPVKEAAVTPAAPTPPDCQPAAEDDPVVGNWLNKRQQKGVTGELRTLFTLKADGSMLFTEQLKRPRQPSQGINESGCWSREGQSVVLRTYTSNGVPVDIDDPIYTNRYRIGALQTDELLLIDAFGQELRTQRTSPGYRLPF